MKQRLLRNRPGSVLRPLARKITKRIHSSKPASLNRPIQTHLWAVACDQRKMNVFFTYTNSPQSNGPWTKENGCILHLDGFTSGQWPVTKEKMDASYTNSPLGSGLWPKKNECLLHLDQLTSKQWPVTKEKWMPSSPTPTHLRAMAHEQRKMDVFFTWMNSPQGNGHDQRKMDVFFTWMNSPQGIGPWPKATENGCLLHLHQLLSGHWTMT